MSISLRESIKAMGSEGRTQMYWAASLARERGIGPYAHSTTETVITVLSNIEETAPLKSKLYSATRDLLDDIIGGGRRRSQPKNPGPSAA